MLSFLEEHMKQKKERYFTNGELLLWCASVALILISFFIFGGSGYLTLVASLIGVTSLIFNAKGNPFGQFLMIVFSLLYGVISFSYSYYGEMITYLGMTAPMALFALISWLCHPYKGRRSQVTVKRLSGKEISFMLVLTVLVTVLFYFVLAYFHTENLPLNTLSVTTSFLAVYMTFRRSPYFALAYAANDVVLILLWILAAGENTAYVSVVVCFAAFLLNDLYCFYNWLRMEKWQSSMLS